MKYVEGEMILKAKGLSFLFVLSDWITPASSRKQHYVYQEENTAVDLVYFSILIFYMENQKGENSESEKSSVIETTMQQYWI